MAPTRFEVVLSHCTSATVWGNSISLQMLDFLSTFKTHPLGFDELAREFLEVCRIMWSLKARLRECLRIHQTLPDDMLQELDRKFKAAHSDFQHLAQWITRFVEYERKGTMGKIQRGWHNIFADTGVHKMKESLAKTKEALRMGAIVFQWSLGDAKFDEAVGIGYTGLEAALDRIDRGKSVIGITKLKCLEQHMVRYSLEEMPAMESILQAPMNRSVTPPVPHLPSVLEMAKHSTELSPFTDGDALSARSIPDLHFPSLVRRTSLSDHTVSLHGSRNHERVVSRSEIYVSGSSGHASSHHASHGHIDEKVFSSTNDHATPMKSESEYQNKPIKVVKIKADPFAMPRLSPRNLAAPTPAMIDTLISAIEARNSKFVEQLLDRGVPANAGSDMHALSLAIRMHDVETVRLLLQFGADPNIPGNISRKTPLHMAVEESFIDGVSILLKYGASPNITGDLDSPLALSVTLNQFNPTRLLLTYGGEPSQKMIDGDTLLIKAIMRKAPRKTIDLLLEYGADPNGKSREGKTPIFEATQSGRPDILSILLDHGADPNLPGPKHVLWPSAYQPQCLKILLSRGADHRKAPGIMELATSINNIDSVRLLIQAGVNLNTKKDGIFTPLCTSIRDNREDIFHLLLSSGADPNMPSAEYPCFKCVTHNRVHLLDPLVKAGGNLLLIKGILEMAVQHNNMDAINWLLDHNVPINDKVPKTGATALTTAIEKNRPELVQLLLSRGADGNVRGEDWPICLAVRRPAILKLLLPTLAEPRAYKGVMEMAVSAGQLASVKLLLHAGVSVEDRNGGVFSPLTTAIREHQKEIMRFLIDKAGADVNAPGEHLPIVKALRKMQSNDTSILLILLNAGASPNKVYRGYSGIIQALETGDVDVLKLLVDKAGVDLNATGYSGKTVLELAQSCGGDEASQILLQARRVHS